MSWQKQLLVTKFYVPVALGSLISRPRLTTLLAKSLKHPFTLVSAPAGFGKTTLLSTWIQSLPARHPRVAWVSLDEEDNDPRLFWSYVLSALQMQHPQRFTPLLTQLQPSQAPPIKQLLTALINLLVESTQHFVLILDDYHVITEQEVHTSLSYLVEHLPAQLHIILSTRTDPPLPLLQLRARRKMLEVRTDQLRCVAAETKTFFKEVMDIEVSDEIIQETTARTEGWLVGLQLLGLSLPERANPLTLLQEVSGSQRYILDYLTEVVLRRQPQEVQRFLQCTCILEQLNAPLCDAVMEQTDSQQMLERLEQANLFVVSLDSKRQWYRYHALFAEALHYQLDRTQADLVPILHHRASLWYAAHDRTSEAILHALRAKEWQWTADLIERKSLELNALTWGVSQHQLFLLRDWLEQIPADVVYSRPRLCLARIWMLMTITPQPVLEAWINTVETRLTAALSQPTDKESSFPLLIPQEQHEQENLLGEALTYRAHLQGFNGESETALMLSQRALALLSADNVGSRAHLSVTRLCASYASSINDAEAALQIGLQASSLNQAAGNTDQAVSIMGVTALHMIGTGKLHETHQLTQQAILLGSKPGAFVLPRIGWPTLLQAEVLREWNELDAALSSIEEAIKLCQQLEWTISPLYLLHGYTILLRVHFSRGELAEACLALQQFERIFKSMNQSFSLYHRAFFNTVDQVRLWLACGELDRATRWLQELEIRERQGPPFAREREEVACVRVLLAKTQPSLALQRLKPVLARATTGQRWGHVIEIHLLQALAHQMHQEEKQALDALSAAIQLAEPENYIRIFVDEGQTIAVLLSKLQAEQRKHGLTPYLDTVLATFFQQSKDDERQPKSMAECTKSQLLLESLSERELEVLQLLAQGVSNREIAQKLVIALDTVKRHVSHIFSKLGVNNRIQAVRRARELGLLDHES
jgi:LuxR family maltose regulon positive regulatory protein